MPCYWKETDCRRLKVCDTSRWTDGGTQLLLLSWCTMTTLLRPDGLFRTTWMPLPSLTVDRLCAKTFSVWVKTSQSDEERWTNITVTSDRQRIQMLNFCYEDAAHMTITIVLLLFTFSLVQIQKMHHVFMYISIWNTVYLHCNLCVDYWHWPVCNWCAL